MKLSIYCSWAGAIQRFQRFIAQMEAQFGDPSPKANCHQEIKNLTTGVLFSGQIYFTIQS